MNGDMAHCFTIISSERLTLCLATEQHEQKCNFAAFERNCDFLNRRVAFQSFIFLIRPAPDPGIS